MTVPLRPIRRVGFLAEFESSFSVSRANAFKAGMSALGYADGRDYVIEIRNAQSNLARLPALAAEFVLNMKTAKALGLKIPGSILVQATKVIE